MDILRILKTKRSYKSVSKIVIVKIIKSVYKRLKITDKFFSRVNIETFVMENDIFIKRSELESLGNTNKEKIVKDAEILLNHKFMIFSTELLYLGREIEWNKDYNTGYKWNDIYFSRINLVNTKNNSDVKYPWELSRFQHLITLGEAYVITNQEKYAEEIVSQIEDWINKNKFNFSVNWTVAMEVSIRATNWIQAINLIRDSKSVDSNFLSRFNKSLYQHLFFILNNLEKGFTTNNHYLSNIFGVFWIITYFRNSNSKRRYLTTLYKIFLAELVEELNYQIYDDGFSYEDSTAYHCFNLEMLLYTTIMLKENDFQVSEDIDKKLDAMINALKVIINTDGTIPLIGDDDSGRFLIYNNYFNSGCKSRAYLLETYNNYFQKGELKLFFKDNYIINYRNRGKLSLGYAGIYVLSNNIFHAHIKCGKFGLDGKGTHTHNDQLSLTLRINDKAFIIDPGTGSYTGSYKIRNELRCTSSHNTVHFEGLEQNDTDYNDIFSLNERTFAKCLNHSPVIFEGEHYGYKNPLNIIHNRGIKLIGNNFEIVDILYGLSKIEQYCYINFVLDEDVVIKTKKNVITLVNGNISVDVITDLKYRIEEVNIAPGYGVIRKSKVIRFISNQDVSRINFHIK